MRRLGFNVSGDFVKGHNLDFLGQLLDDGVKVALVYGDKDYQCNCKHLIDLRTGKDLNLMTCRAGGRGN